MATLAELRRKVQQSLRDFSQKQWEPLELNILLNEAQDRFTRDTQYLRTTDIIRIYQGEGLYTITPPANHRVGNVLSVVYFDGVRDDVPLIPVTLAQMQLVDPDWRHRVTGRPQYLIRNYNPYREGVAANDAVYMYPVLEDPIVTTSVTETRTMTGAAGARVYLGDAVLAAVTSVVNSSTGVAYAETTNYIVGSNYIENVNIPSGTALAITYTVYPCLRVTYALVTNNQMVSDDTEMALTDPIAEQALVSLATAEAMTRQQLIDPERAALFREQAKAYMADYTDRMIRVSVESKVGFSRGFTNSRGYYV